MDGTLHKNGNADNCFTANAFVAHSRPERTEKEKIDKSIKKAVKKPANRRTS